MKKLSLLFFHLWWITAASAQGLRCTPSLFESAHPEIRRLETEMNNNRFEYLSNGQASQRINPPVLTVPVVFHVIHQGGPENIPDSIIIDAVNDVNQRFANLPPFSFSNGVSVSIQLCLASVDPYGNPTSGITRDTSYWAVLPQGWGGSADEMMKNVNRWNPIRYLNVWLPKQTIFAMGTNAYGSYPWMKGMPVDGVVIEALSLGGTNWLLAHELGHYLGLYHNDYNFSCVNFNCLLDGDQVCDTPPEYYPVDCAASSCNTDMDDTSGFNPFTADTIDVSNVMLPIIPCDMVFTAGQADRMYYFLSVGRTELLDAASCTGVLPAIAPPVAGIGVSATSCSGYSFYYTGTGGEYIEWDFNGDGLFDSSWDSINYSYPTPGYRTVVQRVFNGVGHDYDTLVIYAQPTGNTNFPMQSITSNNYTNNGNFLCSGSLVTFTAMPNMAQYIWSTGDSTQSITLLADSASTFSISLTCIDSAGIVWQHCPDPVYSWTVVPTPTPLTFAPVTNDTVCEGEFFKAVWSAPGSNLVVSQYITNGWPGVIQDTVLLWFSNIPDQYIGIAVRDLSTYCQAWSDTLYAHFNKLIPGPLQPAYSGITMWITDTAAFHQWYLNGVAIQGAVNDTLIATAVGCYSYAAWDVDPDCQTVSGDYCLTTLGEEELLSAKNIIINPNPAGNTFSVSLKNSTQITVDPVLLDCSGKQQKVEKVRKADGEFQFDSSKLEDGMYLLRWGNFSSRIIILH